MSDNLIKVLLVEDNPGDACLMREMLAEARDAPFDLECTDQLSTGLERLTAGGIEVILLDLSLPDSWGLDTFIKVHAEAPTVPIIVLTVLDDETLAVEAVREGAQDYLVKGQVDGNSLVRAMRYAIERQRAEEELHKVRDELEKHNTRLEALYRVVQMVNSTLEPDAILDRLTDEAMRVTRATHGQVLVVREDIGRFKRCSLRGFSPEEMELARTVPLPLDQGINGRVYTTRQAVRVDDVQAEPGYFPLIPITRTELAVPIIRDGQVLGNLDLQSPEVGAFRDVDLDYLNTLANQVAIALANAQIFHAVEQARRDWEATFNAMRDAVALVHRDHRIVQANQAFMDIAPGTLRQVMGQRYDIILDGASCPEAACPLEQTLESGRPATCVHEYGGRVFEVQTIPVWEGDVEEPGYVARMVYVMRDITERKRAEETLRDNIQRMGIAYQQATVYARELKGEIAERKRAEETLKRRLEQLASLNQASQAVTASLRLDQVLAKIVSLAREVAASDYASVVLIDEKGRLDQGAEDLPGVPAIEHRIRDKGFTHWIARSHQAIVIDNINEDGTVNPEPANGAPRTANPFVVEAGVKSFVGLPLVAKDRLLGVLHLHSLRPGNFRDQLPLLTIFANQVTVALENARLYSQLENRERLITRILESIPTSLVTIDRSLRVVSVNRNFLEKTRRKAQTTLGHKIEDLFPQVLMEYTQMDQKVREVLRTGEPVEGGKVAYRAPGLPTRIYYYRLIPLKAEEMVDNVMLLMDDITEREQLGEEVRRAERHLASVVECANDLVISMNPQGHIVTWNRAAERAAGLKVEEVKEQPMLSLCVTEQQPVMAEILQRLARGEGVQNSEVNLLTANGQEVPIAWSCSPMRDDAGKVVGIVAVGRDLTERRQMESQLIQSAKTASLGVMAGGIAHELRNPLGIISASAQLLLERPDDAQLRNQCAQKIHAATQRASMIIENLLKFARPQSKRVREVDLHAVLEEICALLAHQMALQKVTLRKELQPDLLKVYGNPDLLQQVFTNLILNACNAMPQGGTLKVITRSTEAGEAEIQFSDTGQGIPSKNLPKIFDPFFTTMPVGKGVGLGLSISYSIVQQHQGTIKVESQVGKGSTFTVRLPVNSR